MRVADQDKKMALTRKKEREKNVARSQKIIIAATLVDYNRLESIGNDENVIENTFIICFWYRAILFKMVVVRLSK
jgi:hypothetical protein